MSSTPPKKILIVLLGAIGDVVRALPLAVRIKRAWPESQISWAIEPRSKDVITGHGAIDQIIVFNRPQGLPAFISFIKQIRAEKFDLVLDLQRHIKSGVTSFFSGSSNRIGFHPRNAKEFNWLFNNQYIDWAPNFSLKIEHYQKFGDKLAIAKVEPLDFGFQFDEQATARVRAIIADADQEQNNTQHGRFAALILGSTWESRFWFPDKYAEVVRALKQRYDICSLLIGADSERQFADSLLNLTKQEAVVDLVGKTRLKDLPPLFSLCDFAIGSDSGPMHLAAAAGIPVISLWGATSPIRSAPYGSQHLVLQAGVGCSPCYRAKCPGLGQVCMSGISSEAVMEKVSNPLSVKQQKSL